MIKVAVLVPVLGRPERARPLVESLVASVTGPVVSATLLFLVSPGDLEQEEACRAAHAYTTLVPWEPGVGDYASKINYGWRLAEAEGDVDFVLLGADDLRFHPGWLEAALTVQLQTGACVVGTNDLGNPAVMNGTHATHPLVHVSYGDCGTADGTVGLLHEGYDHCFVDNEFVGTAKARDTFAFARESRVEHLHPIWRKGSDDATYRKGQRAFDADRRLHEARRALWGGR